MQIPVMYNNPSLVNLVDEAYNKLNVKKTEEISQIKIKPLLIQYSNTTIFNNFDNFVKEYGYDVTIFIKFIEKEYNVDCKLHDNNVLIFNKKITDKQVSNALIKYNITYNKCTCGSNSVTIKTKKKKLEIKCNVCEKVWLSDL